MPRIPINLSSKICFRNMIHDVSFFCWSKRRSYYFIKPKIKLQNIQKKFPSSWTQKKQRASCHRQVPLNNSHYKILKLHQRVGHKYSPFVWKMSVTSSPHHHPYFSCQNIPIRHMEKNIWPHKKTWLFETVDSVG